MGQAVGEGFAATDAMLMERVNYEEWAAYWPQQDPEENPIGATMNGRRKYVVSTTLEEPLEWSNSTLIKGNEFAEEIGNLKEQEGKDIVISGSGTLVRSLLCDGLLDELKLMIHPIVVGRGRGFVGLAAFQAALALGAPLGGASWCGVHEGKLPRGLRIVSGVAVGFHVLAALIMLGRGGYRVVP